MIPTAPWKGLNGVLVGALCLLPLVAYASWTYVPDRVCSLGVTVIHTLDGDFEANGQSLDFGPTKKWTDGFDMLGGPNALANLTVDLGGIVDTDGNLEVYRVRHLNADGTVDFNLCTRLAGTPTGRPTPGCARGGGGTPCPGPSFDFDADCN